MKDSADQTYSDFSHQPVPRDSRRGFWSMLIVMMGFTFFSASMWTGGRLGAGLTAERFFLAVLGGNLILGGYTGALAHIAATTGLSTHRLAHASFGVKGSWFPSALLGITQVGWFGVGVVMFALPVQKVTGINLYLLIAVGGLLMTTTAYFGIKALALLSLVAVPAIALLGMFSVEEAVRSTGGMASLLAITPEQPLSFSVALTLCVGSFISGGTLTADFTRFARTSRTAVSTTVLAFFIGNSLMFVFGAVGAALYQQADISEVMLRQGLIVPAMLVLGLNIWTTNDSALYASGLAFANISGLPKKAMVVVNGTLGSLAAMLLYEHFVGFLTLLGACLPPIGAIIITDYFMHEKQRWHDQVVFDARVRLSAVVAWLAGCAAAQLLPGLPPLNGLFAAALVYLALECTLGRSRSSENLTPP
ncbi:cytosine permease [Desulfuromonas acetoxidans]|nr:cytosine permease [Desulfuromonas acetoxidans]MBF0646665.1 cytosine permease [Desulfuromonas acetoxidans]NVD25768.1 cytosine permease [Desulfuromonas acetoxidans]NVE17746.1 cytosine permease [Desulfuromonas acetoxidans]